MSRRRRRRAAGEVEFWPGFTDVLAGMLLTMVFVLTLFAITQAGLVNVVGGQDAELKALENQVAELRRLLAQSDERATTLQGELLAATKLVEELGQAQTLSASELDRARADLATEKGSADALRRELAAYVEQLEELTARLAAAEEVSGNRKATIADLQLAVNRLRGQLAEMAEKLQTAEEQAGAKALELSELLTEMARKDERIAELEQLERYTSEFLAKMSNVFRDNPNITVVGDRFVFQSEVLFESGSADLGEAGKGELDKFVTAFLDLMPRIPSDLDVNVQVQGHTDVDRVVLSDRFRSNWELSTARALGVVDYLAANGVPNRMMSAAGFGEHFPRAAGRTPEAKALNRRIEIRITSR